MSARVGILVFPGTNSEDETQRACQAVGLDADLVHWSVDLDRVREYDAYVLGGGFAYEDRVRAGAIAAHDRVMSVVREGAAKDKPVLGICNGAQILIEAGLVPALDGRTDRPQAAFARNAPLGQFRSKHVHMKLVNPPERCVMTASLPHDTIIPAWASHGEGRLAADDATLDRIVKEWRVAFVYCEPNGNVTPDSTPNGSAFGVAGLINDRGNILAVMPHPERDSWTFNHNDASREAARGDTQAMLAPSGGIALFAGLAAALRR